MLSRGLLKTAVAIVTMTPEEYYEHVGAKDKYVGALAGNLTGAAAGLKKGKPGQKAKAALIAGGAGTVLGGVGGHSIGKLVRELQAHRVRKLTGELNLRSTPSRRSYESPDQE